MSISITKITPQKKSKKRFSLYSGEEFITGISEETLISFAIYPGCQIDAVTLKRIKNNEKKISLRNQALRFLANRPHSTKELTKKLIQKKFDKKNILSLLNDFKDKGYLNDEEFFIMLMQEEMQLKKNGPLLIKNKLVNKGMEPLSAEALITMHYNEEVQQENCRMLAVKKVKFLLKYSAQEKKNKLVNFLRQRGFYWETMRKVIEELNLTED